MEKIWKHTSVLINCSLRIRFSSSSVSRFSRKAESKYLYINRTFHLILTCCQINMTITHFIQKYSSYNFKYKKTSRILSHRAGCYKINSENKINHNISTFEMDSSCSTSYPTQIQFWNNKTVYTIKNLFHNLLNIKIKLTALHWY